MTEKKKKRKKVSKKSENIKSTRTNNKKQKPVNRKVKKVKAPKERRKIQIPKPEIHFEVSAKAIKGILIIAAALLVIACTMMVFADKYRVDTIVVEGNTHYTTEEINQMVMGDSFFAKNSIYLSLKYRNKEIKDIPFIESMSVKVLSPTSIKVVIYEKALAGYVEYMGRFFYFDKDGTVVESSDVKTYGIPQVLGMKFNYIVLYEKLPVSDERIFREILDVSQLARKYEIDVDKIYFDDEYNITLYFGEARVKLGNYDNIDEKMIRLKAILPELEGKKGVLRMENYTVDSAFTSFEVEE